MRTNQIHNKENINKKTKLLVVEDSEILPYEMCRVDYEPLRKDLETAIQGTEYFKKPEIHNIIRQRLIDNVNGKSLHEMFPKKHEYQDVNLITRPFLKSYLQKTNNCKNLVDLLLACKTNYAPSHSTGQIIEDIMNERFYKEGSCVEEEILEKVWDEIENGTIKEPFRKEGNWPNKNVLQTKYTSEFCKYLETELNKKTGQDISVDFEIYADNAIKKIKDNNYDFIISDLGLPTKNQELENKAQEILTTSKYEEAMSKLDAEKIKYSKNEGILKLVRNSTPAKDTLLQEPYSYHAGMGVFVAEVAEKANIDYTLFTSYGHFQAGIMSALICDKINLEEYRKLTSAYQPKEDFVNAGKLYIGNKERFADIITKMVKQHINNKTKTKK